jgi:hypothetical protein
VPAIAVPTLSALPATALTASASPLSTSLSLASTLPDTGFGVVSSGTVLASPSATGLSLVPVTVMVRVAVAVWPMPSETV